MPQTALFLALFGGLLSSVTALENGLARTPPMGWMNWQRYRCVVDCKKYPDDCVNEELFRRTADLMVSDGYQAAGYNYLIIDDCWMAKDRDREGYLVADPERFPSGIKALAAYVHKKGLKFGIYASYGTYTCMGFPGSKNYLEKDAQTFADWGADFLKFDGCYANPANLDEGYKTMGQHLIKTGRRIVYSCSWPFYQEINNKKPNFEAISQHCNMWRNWLDVEDSYEVVAKIIEWYKMNLNRTGEFTGPGRWSDPDMLVIGNFGLSYEQSKTQMAIWAILAAPLLMSVDLTKIEEKYKNILLNQEVIAINQDQLGISGRWIKTIDKIDIWTKKIKPSMQEHYSYAIVFHSNRVDGYPYRLEVTLAQFGLKYTGGYIVKNIFEGGESQKVTPNDVLEVRVKPTGVVLLKATLFVDPMQQKSKPKLQFSDKIDYDELEDHEEET